jgi:methionyl-tRNA formyltransferase
LYTRWKGKLLKVLEATVVSGDGRPGLVVPLEQAGVPCGVATGQGVLGLRRVLLEGKRAVSSAEFVQGYRDFISSELPC